MKALLLFFIPFTLLSQQDPLSGMYWNNYSIYNPATSGLEYKHDGYLTYRSQWKDSNGAPTMLFANANGRIANHHGVGINYFYDKIGYSIVHSGNANYNYQLLFNDESRLAIGLGIGLHALKYDANWIPPATINDPLIPSSDNSYSLNLNAGIAYLKKSFYLGAGMLHLDQSRQGNVYLKRLHSYFHARLKLLVGPKSDYSKHSQLFISCLTRTDWVYVSTDINLRILFRDQIWLGIGYRTSNALLATIGWDVKRRFRIAYQFENFYSKLSQGFSSVSHEIALGFYLE